MLEPYEEDTRIGEEEFRVKSPESEEEFRVKSQEPRIKTEIWILDS
jgi:hypothetical protein